jgi:hypothetical protein
MAHAYRRHQTTLYENNRKPSTVTVPAGITNVPIDLADLGAVGVTSKYTVCQNVNCCVNW